MPEPPVRQQLRTIESRLHFVEEKFGKLLRQLDGGSSVLDSNDPDEVGSFVEFLADVEIMQICEADDLITECEDMFDTDWEIGLQSFDDLVIRPNDISLDVVGLVSDPQFELDALFENLALAPSEVSKTLSGTLVAPPSIKLAHAVDDDKRTDMASSSGNPRAASCVPCRSLFGAPSHGGGGLFGVSPVGSSGIFGASSTSTSAYPASSVITASLPFPSSTTLATTLAVDSYSRQCDDATRSSSRSRSSSASVTLPFLAKDIKTAILCGDHAVNTLASRHQYGVATFSAKPGRRDRLPFKGPLQGLHGGG